MKVYFFWAGRCFYKEIYRSWPYAGVESIKIQQKSQILSRPFFFCHGHILEIVTATFKVSRATFWLKFTRANYIFHGEILAFLSRAFLASHGHFFHFCHVHITKFHAEKKKNRFLEHLYSIQMPCRLNTFFQSVYLLM